MTNVNDLASKSYPFEFHPKHKCALVTLVAENLATYMESMRLYARGMYCKLT